MSENVKPTSNPAPCSSDCYPSTPELAAIVLKSLASQRAMLVELIGNSNDGYRYHEVKMKKLNSQIAIIDSRIDEILNG